MSSFAKNSTLSISTILAVTEIPKPTIVDDVTNSTPDYTTTAVTASPDNGRCLKYNQLLLIWFNVKLYKIYELMNGSDIHYFLSF